MTTFGIALNTSRGFFMDKDSGIFYELLTYPITRRQFLFGTICFNVLLSATGALLAILLGAWALDVAVRWLWLPVTMLVKFACFMAFTLVCLLLAVRTIDRVG